MSNSFKTFCAEKVKEWSNKINALLPGKEEYDNVYDELSVYGSWKTTDLGIDKLEPNNNAYNDAVRICDKWESIFRNMEVNEHPEVLDLAEVGLEFFPIEICELERLTSLDLSINKLTTLPAEIRRLTNLASLNLSNNEITTLPAEIGQLTNLKYLNFSGNNIPLSSYISWIGNLKKIEEFIGSKGK